MYRGSVVSCLQRVSPPTGKTYSLLPILYPPHASHTAPFNLPPEHSCRRSFVLPHPIAGAAALIDPRPFLSLFRASPGSSRTGVGNIRPVAMGTPREPMGAERQKIRVAKWLYRWNLRLGVLASVF